MRQAFDRQGPRDSQARVVAGNSAFGFGHIEGGVKVQQFAIWFQYLKAVGAAFGNVERELVVGGDSQLAEWR